MGDRHRHGQAALRRNGSNAPDQRLDEIVRIVGHDDLDILGRDQSLVAQVDLELIGLAREDDGHDERFFNDHVRNRHLRLEHRLEHDAIAILDLDRHHGPAVGHGLADEEGLQRRLDARLKQRRPAEGVVFGGRDIDRVSAFGQAHEAHYPGRIRHAVRHRLAGERIGDCYRRIGQLRTARHVVGVIIRRRNHQVTHRRGHGAETIRQGQPHTSVAQANRAVVDEQGQISRRFQQEVHGRALTRLQGGQLIRARNFHPAHRRQQHIHRAAGHTTHIADGERHERLPTAHHAAIEDRRIGDQLRTQRRDVDREENPLAATFRRSDVDREHHPRRVGDGGVQRPVERAARMARQRSRHVQGQAQRGRRIRRPGHDAGQRHAGQVAQRDLSADRSLRHNGHGSAFGRDAEAQQGKRVLRDVLVDPRMIRREPVITHLRRQRGEGHLEGAIQIGVNIEEPARAATEQTHRDQPETRR